MELQAVMKPLEMVHDQDVILHVSELGSVWLRFDKTHLGVAVGMARDPNEMLGISLVAAVAG